MTFILVNPKEWRRETFWFCSKGLTCSENPLTVFCRAFAAEMESKGPCGKIADVYWVESMLLCSAHYT